MRLRAARRVAGEREGGAGGRAHGRAAGVPERGLKGLYVVDLDAGCVLRCEKRCAAAREQRASAGATLKRAAGQLEVAMRLRVARECCDGLEKGEHLERRRVGESYRLLWAK